MLVVILPSLMLNLMLALHALQDGSHPDKSTGKHPTLQGVFFVVMLLCLLPVGAKAVSNTFDAEERAHLDEVSRVGRELNEYVIAHQPTVYVQTVAVSDSIDPRLIYPESKPSNSFCAAALSLDRSTSKPSLSATGSRPSQARCFAKMERSLLRT